MATKTFRAETIMEALQLVQTEFGPEAIVLSVREVPVGPAWQVWRQPGCEVIAASSQADAEAAKAKPSLELADGVEWIDEPLDKKAAQAPAPAHAPAAENRPSVPVILRGAPIAPANPTAKMDAKPWLPPKVSFPGEEPALPAPLSKGKGQGPANSGAAAEVVEMKVAEPAPTVEEKPAPMAEKPFDPGPTLTRLQQHLIAQGVDEPLVRRIVTTCAQAFSPASQKDESRVQAYLQRQLESLLKVQARAQLDNPARVICLVGPSGSGKTSACARLAAYYGARGKSVAWISVDTVRAGAIAEARTFVEALGIELHVAYTPEELTWKMEAAAGAGLVVVDTPGYNPCSEMQMAELGGFLTQMPDRSTYLLAPATTKESDLAQVYAALKPFKLRGLVLTKMDETLTLGSLYNFAWHSQLPLAYFTSGKSVLDDFALASANRLVAALFAGGK